MAADTAHALQSLFWETTLRCNAFCEFCGSRCGEQSAQALCREELPAQVICNCFREIAQAYDPAKIMLNITGGEPLLRQDLFDIMAYASGLGFPWGLVTNGSLIDRAAVEKMKSTGMKTISISLDGLPETHNALRRLPDGFAKIEKAVALLKEADFLDEIQITTVVNHRNLPELEPLLGILLRWGIDSWRLAAVDPIGRAEQQESLLLTDAEHRQYLQFFREHQFNGKLILTTSCSHYLGDCDNLYRPHRFSCETGKHIASILANGDIYVCPNVPRIPGLIQGNIQKDSFPAVWENGFQWFRNPDRQKSARCESCTYYDRCRGDSLHTWDFSANAPKVCFRDRQPEPAPRSCEAQLKEKLLAYYPGMKGIRIHYKNSAAAKLLFTPPAARQLLAFFEWGQTSARNCFELLAGLAGFTVGDLIVAEYVIPGNLEDRNETTAAFSQRNYAELLREVEILKAGRAYAQAQYRLSDSCSLVGIAHTHPLELKPVLSLPDLRLHGQLQREHPGFVSLLLNPQKKQLAAYSNSVFTPIDVELLTEDGAGSFGTSI